MKNKALYISILVACFAFVAWLDYVTPRPLNWTVTYSKDDKIPYGSYILYEILPQIFQNATLTANNKTLYELLDEPKSDYKECAYLFINESFTPSEQETNTLFEMAKQGATFFIASDEVSGSFADTLHLEMDSNFSPWQVKLVGNDKAENDFVPLRLMNPQINSTYYYKRNAVSSSFFKQVNFPNENPYLDEKKIKILGTNGLGYTNFIYFPFGEGGFYLHSTPLVFTNYNLLEKENYQYVAHALSYLNQRQIIWDEYYKTGRKQSDSPMRFVLQNESLKYAWWTLLVTVALFIAFRSKRTQRIIPILKAPQNTTLAFTETVGMLYFQRRDDADLARKKVTYFLEFIRKHFYLNTSELNDEFVQNLANKSGYDHNKLKRLFGLVADTKQYEVLSETLLHEINRLIEEFYDFVELKR